MDYHVLTFTKNINLDRLILIQFLELSKKKKKRQPKKQNKKTEKQQQSKAKQNGKTNK